MDWQMEMHAWATLAYTCATKNQPAKTQVSVHNYKACLVFAIATYE